MTPATRLSPWALLLFGLRTNGRQHSPITVNGEVIAKALQATRSQLRLNQAAIMVNSLGSPNYLIVQRLQSPPGT